MTKKGRKKKKEAPINKVSPTVETKKETPLTKEELFNYLNQISTPKQPQMQQTPAHPNLTPIQNIPPSQDPTAAAPIQNTQMQQTPGNIPPQVQNIPPQINTRQPQMQQTPGNIPPQVYTQQPQMQQNMQQIPQHYPPRIKLTPAQEKRIIANEMIKLHKSIMILGFMFFIIPSVIIFVTLFDPVIAMIIFLVGIIYPAICVAKSLKQQEYLGNKYHLKTYSFVKQRPQRRNQGVELF